MMKLAKRQIRNRSLNQIIKNHQQNLQTPLLIGKQKEFRNTVMINNTNFQNKQPIFYNKAIDINLPKHKYKISCRNKRKQHINFNFDTPIVQNKQYTTSKNNKKNSLFRKWTQISTQLAVNDFQEHPCLEFQKLKQIESKCDIRKLFKYISSYGQIRSHKKKINSNSFSCGLGIKGNKIKQSDFLTESKNFSIGSFTKQRKNSFEKDDIKKHFSLKSQSMKFQKANYLKKKIIDEQALSGWN